MKTKILGILVMTLLIATAFSVNGCVELNDIKSNISIDKGMAGSSTTADYKSFFNRHKEGESNILTNNGNWQWAKQAGGTGKDVGVATTTLSDDSIIVIGNFQGTATFGPGESAETVLVSDGSDDIFVAHYNPDGTIAWGKRAGGTSGDAGRGIVALSDGSTIVTGSFSGSATFGPGESAETVLVSDGSDDIFVVHYNWDGTIAWGKRAGGTDYDFGNGVSADGNGNTYITGSFMGIADFGPYTLTSPRNNDVFVAKLSDDGGNFPPNTQIDGLTNGKAGVEYSYSLVSTDPNGDDVYYYIEWGDGQIEDWFGLYPSGETQTVKHTWTAEGTYTIKAKAKDIHDAESDWAKLSVTMPKNKPYINTPFLRFLEQHPHLFPLLRQLLNLQ